MNKTQAMAMSPYELLKYKREQLDLMSSKITELDTLKNATHDCKESPHSSCAGCARIELTDDEITYHDLQINLINEVLESNEYATQPHVKEEERMIDNENSSAVKHELN